MITNRNIETPELFDDALVEVIESAQECGVSNATLVAVLRDHATRLDGVSPE